MVSKKGQAVMEYVLMIGLVAAALGLMQVYLKRGVQAGIKIASDELGSQKEAEEKDPRKGFTKLLQSRSYTLPDQPGVPGQPSVQKKTLLGGGGIKMSIDETIRTEGTGEYLSNWEEK